jgi:mannan endo-1,6-alpha-mannosidase
MAAAAEMAPFIADQVHKVLVTSATAAALQCSGGANGRLCGLKWTDGAAWDGTAGVGQQMSALEVIISTQFGRIQAPFTNTTGGTSIGNPNAGAGSVDTTDGLTNDPVTTGDRAGAGILTAVVVVALVGGVAWMVIGE